MSIDPELEKQMEMLEGLDLGMEEPISQAAAPQSATNEVANNAEVSFINQPVQAQVSSVQQQAQAQVVQQTQTVAQPVQAQPVQTQTVAQPVQAQPAQAVAQPQVNLNEAPVFVNLGENTYKTKTDFLKLKENEATRVTLVNYNASGVHFHYETGLGYFKCLSTYGDPTSDWPTIKGVCCLQPNPQDKTKVVGKGKVKVFLPVIEYPVSKTDGKTLISGSLPKLKVLALSKQEYDTLFEVQKEYGADTSTFDLSITRKRSDRGGFLEYKLTPGPSWRSKFQGAIEAEASKLTNEVYNLAAQEYAKVLSEERVIEFYNEKAKQEIMAQQIANQQVPTTNDINLNIV